uniref:Transposable element activator uncharacterized 12 kDa protein n=1 Tax=Zea mays TaxID=4577 RepID=YAC1_MAIZE|nr:RecName: Full=Transposable element activator uncharacterized 12 kDa protein; Short=AC 12 kDa protein [Zea mays]ABB59983.1 unknown [Immobile Ac/T-DNA vector pKU352NA]ABB59988.1 unknown [Immobile Ac/T-DNA vector pNU400]CAA29006.1 ORFb [Zea mays]
MQMVQLQIRVKMIWLLFMNHNHNHNHNQNHNHSHNLNPKKKHHRRGQRSAHRMYGSISPRRKLKWRSMERNTFRYGDIATFLIARLSIGLRVIMEQADFEIT